jgi:hypothetical protein
MAKYEHIGTHFCGLGELEFVLITCKAWLYEVEARAHNQAVLIIWIDYQDKRHYQNDSSQDENCEPVKKMAEIGGFFH